MSSISFCILGKNAKEKKVWLALLGFEPRPGHAEVWMLFKTREHKTAKRRYKMLEILDNKKSRFYMHIHMLKVR